MRRRAKKPKILKNKINVANLLRGLGQQGKIPMRKFRRRPRREFWWRGEFQINGNWYFIFFQRYVQRPGVDSVSIRHSETFKTLSPREIKELEENLRKE